MKRRLCLGLFLLLCAIVGAQDYKWHKSLEINGNGIMQGPPIDLRGSKWRVRYSSKDNSPILIELFSVDGSSKKEIIRSNNKQSSSGTRVVDYKGGFDKGYLCIRGSYSGWKVIFEQYVDDIRGWELTRLAKNQQDFTKIAVWSGDGGEAAEMPFSIQDKCIRISMKNKGQGRLKIEVLDSDNNPVATAYMFTANTYESWLYANGEYKLRINSNNAPWVVEVNALK